MRWFSLVAVAALVVPFSGCVEDSFEPVPSADWKPGYTFGYGATMSTEVDGRMEINGKEVEAENGREESGPHLSAFRVVNTTQRHGDKPLYLAVASGQMASLESIGLGMEVRYPRGAADGFLTALRHEDLGPVAMNACSNCGSGGSPRLTFHDRESYPLIRFPLVHGDSWSGTLPGGELDVASKVRGKVTKMGPEGPVDAIRITHSARLDMDRVRDEALAEAKKQGIQVNHLELDFRADLEVYYAPSLHSVVLFTGHFVMHVDADFVYEGQAMRMSMDGTSEFEQRLLYADLSESPELGLAEAFEAVAEPPELPLPPVPGSTPGPGGTLRTTADRSHVNAAEEPVVRFATDLTGTAKATKFTVTDGDGRVVASGDGGDFTFQVKEPGNYVASVNGVDGNGKRLSSKANLVADHETTIQETCPVVATLGLFRCPVVDVPVRTGLQHLEVSATRTGPLDTGGMLRLILADGTRHTAAMEGGTATITLESAAAGDADLYYSPTVGVAEEVEYAIRLLHSQPGDAAQTATGLLALEAWRPDAWLSRYLPPLVSA